MWNPNGHRLPHLSPTWDPTRPLQSLTGISGLRADPPCGAKKSQHPASTWLDAPSTAPSWGSAQTPGNFLNPANPPAPTSTSFLMVN